MTADHNPDRIVGAWLDLMPDEAPDRVIADVLQAVETTPQVRRSLRRTSWRSMDMNRFSIAAAIAAVALVAIGGALWLGHPGSGLVGAPSPTATEPSAPSPTAISSAAGVLPSGLQGRWLGGPRAVPGIAAGAGTTILLTPDSFLMTQSNQQQDTVRLRSSASIDVAGNLSVDSPADGAPCATGDSGTYSWSLSPSGQTLTIRAASDDCAVRLAALPGTWWLSDCKSGDPCLGDIDAGTYGSQFVDPRWDPATSWAPRYGALSFTVPEGWASSADWPSSFALTPSPAYAVETKDGPPQGVLQDIYVVTRPAAAVQDVTCSGTPDPAVGTSVEALLGWIRSLPLVSSGDPTAVTIDGHPATMIDIRFDSTRTASCPGDARPSTLLFVPSGRRDDEYAIGIDAADRIRLILLDLGGGNVVGIAIEDQNDATGADQARFDALVTAAMPIVESFSFR
jgi:hypothetical protein